MAEPTSDEAADAVRDAIAPVRSSFTRSPEEFGLRFLSADELIELAESSAQPAHARRFGRTRVVAVVSGLVAAAAVTAAVVVPRLGSDAPAPIADPSPSSTRTSSTVYASARSVLLAAAERGGPSARDAAYWHVKSIQVFGAERVPREIWLGNRRPSILRQDGIVEELPPAAFPAAGTATGWAALQALPTDVVALRNVLAGDSSSRGRDERWVVFKAAGDLIAEAPLPPAVRTAVWRVLAAESGARATERTVDSAGRSGWTVSMSVAGEGTLTFVVDPASGELLEVRHGEVPGSPAWSVTFLERGPADSAPKVAGA